MEKLVLRGTKAIYKYDSDGLRSKKVANGVTTDYKWLDGTLLSQKSNGEQIVFLYDENGTIYGMTLNLLTYFYIFNLQGDVIGILNQSGQKVVEYTYDAWGNILSITGTQAGSIGQKNPIRYRGYYYDTETGFYYLNSRYYDPEIGRFINADEYASTGQGLIGHNMYAYCGNNPISRRDISGHAWETAWDIISLGASIAEVVANPAVPWAWAGLVGDVVDVAVPFVGGLGEAVDVVKTSSRVVANGSDIIDAAKNMRRTADVSDNIKDSTGVYVVLYEQGQHYIGKGGFNRAITSATEHMAVTNKATAIIWAPMPSKKSAFVAEYLLQSTFGLHREYKNSYNIIWSPGKKILRALQ